MRKKSVPLSRQEKWFIANAAQIEKDATMQKIAAEIGRSPPAIRNVIREGGLRSKEQIREAWITALKSRHFPAHEKIPRIIALLEETKVKKNLSLANIAKACVVSPAFVRAICERHKILSPEEIRELWLKFKAKAKPVDQKVYLKARELLQKTNLNEQQIAEKLGVSNALVSRANKGKGDDKRIRSKEKQIEIRWGLKPINFFSAKQKLELIELYKKMVAGKLRVWEVPLIERERIIGRVSDALFRQLDYFDPNRGIPIEHFLKSYTKGDIYAYSRQRKKPVSLEVATKEGKRPVADKRATGVPDAVAMREILSKIGNIISPTDKDILLEIAEGVPLRTIGKQRGLSYETIRLRAKKARKKLARHFKEKNEH